MMLENVQSCFELSIHFSVFAAGLWERHYKQMHGKFKMRLDVFYHSYISQFFSVISFALCLKFLIHEFTSDSHTNAVISRRVCLSVKMASETVTRSKVFIFYYKQLF